LIAFVASMDKHQQRVQISTNTKYTTLVTKKVNTPTPSIWKSGNALTP
jgi:hypothetical protein